MKSRLTKWILIFALFGFYFGIIGSHRVTSNDFSPVGATEIKLFQAFEYGALKPDLVVTTRTNGTCWSKSVANGARPDAWRCRADSLILDPCFHDETSIVCIFSPWTKKVSVLEPSSTLPKPNHFTLNVRSASPWAVELSNGERCTFLTGASCVVNNLRINYECSYNSHIIGNIDQSQPLWVARLYYSKTNKTLRIPIVKAWY